MVFQKGNHIRGLLNDKAIFLIVDEAEIAKQKYIRPNVLVGSLETPTDPYLIECLTLESYTSVNSGFILHTVDDILQSLAPNEKISHCF